MRVGAQPLKPMLRFFKECFEYNPKTGDLLWKHRPPTHFASEASCRRFNTMYAGKPAGTPNTEKGHLQVHFLNYGNFYVHRIVWILTYGKDPGPNFVLDHKNGQSTANRLKNLRKATSSQNAYNSKTYKNNISGVKGVSWDTRSKLWRASIQQNGTRHQLGYFEQLEDAVKARKRAERKFHGRFARKR
jgi:hypothetical protein